MEPMDAHDELLDDAEERVELARRLLYARAADAFKPGTAGGFRVAAKTLRGRGCRVPGRAGGGYHPRRSARILRYYRRSSVYTFRR